jgi:hypothetical protein
MDRRGFEAGTDGSAEGERKRPCSRCGDSSLFLDADSRLPAARTARERNKVAPEVLSKTPTLITKGKLCSFFFFLHCGRSQVGAVLLGFEAQHGSLSISLSLCFPASLSFMGSTSSPRSRLPSPRLCAHVCICVRLPRSAAYRVFTKRF